MNGTITLHIPAREEGLGNLDGAEKDGKKSSSTAGITVAESLGTRTEPALGWVTNVKVANEEPKCRRGMLAIALPRNGVSAGGPVQ